MQHYFVPYRGDAVDEVGDVAADGPDGGQLLPLAEPLLHLDRLLVRHVDVHCQVPEGLGQGAAGALDGHHAGLDGDVDLLGDLHLLRCVDELHPGMRKTKGLGDGSRAFKRPLNETERKTKLVRHFEALRRLRQRLLRSILKDILFKELHHLGTLKLSLNGDNS